ncbi:MAG: multicopper oxidase family protein [Actinocatenispora sp.]
MSWPDLGPPRHPTRRDVLATAVGGTLAALTGCGDARVPDAGRVAPDGPEVTHAEAARHRSGAGTVDARLEPRADSVDLGGRTVRTWAYDGAVPGPLLRGDVGDQMRVRLTNRLPAPTTAHWHGVALRNDADGVPHLTQPPVPPGCRHEYAFTLPRPGTYWYHSHLGVQRDRGLYGPLIVDDPHEPGDYDVEFVVVIDDWIDGAGTTPDGLLHELRSHPNCWRYQTPVRAGAVGGAGAARPTPRRTTDARGAPLMGIPPGMGGEIDYPYHLINGRLPTAAATLRAKAGQLARIRLINASAATVYRVALGGHRLTVTDSDAYPIVPVTVDTLDIASGERYDVTTRLDDGVFPLTAVAQGKQAQARCLVRTGAGTVPDVDAQPRELDGRRLRLRDMTAAESVRLPAVAPDVTHDLWFDGDMTAFTWKIDGNAYTADDPFHGIRPLGVHLGDRVRLRLNNQTPMYHPIHLHGHTYQIRGYGTAGEPGDTAMHHGARKDTVLIAPNQRVTVDLVADNPGQWLTHCHNAYHLAAGMATILSYRR